MYPVPYSVMNDYVALLRIREIPPAHVEHYKKWLLYFYDFKVQIEKVARLHEQDLADGYDGVFLDDEI